jgi:hypothetical protein
LEALNPPRKIVLDPKDRGHRYPEGGSNINKSARIAADRCNLIICQLSARHALARMGAVLQTIAYILARCCPPQVRSTDAPQMAIPARVGGDSIRRWSRSVDVFANHARSYAQLAIMPTNRPAVASERKRPNKTF